MEQIKKAVVDGRNPEPETLEFFAGVVSQQECFFSFPSFAKFQKSLIKYNHADNACEVIQNDAIDA